MAVYCENQIKQVNALCERNVELLSIKTRYTQLLVCLKHFLTSCLGIYSSCVFFYSNKLLIRIAAPEMIFQLKTEKCISMDYKINEKYQKN